MKGGYFNIDCAGLDLEKGETPQTKTGLYARMQKAIKANKPVFAYNWYWTSTSQPVTPIQVMLIQFDGYIIATASTFQVIVTSADSVTIINLVA